MKKFFYLAAMCLLAAFSLSSCNKDDEGKNLTDNQMLMDGKVAEVTVALGIRPAGVGWPGDPGAYYFDVMPVDQSLGWHGRFDLGLPLIGKTVDLAHPEKAIEGYQFSVYFDEYVDMYDPTNLFGLEGEKGFIEGKEQDGSCFKSGSFVTSHPKEGFHLTMSGVLVNGKKISLKAFVPQDDIKYWD